MKTIMVIVLSLIVYLTAFVEQERQRQSSIPTTVEPALPTTLHRLVFGPLSELGAEILFVRTTVFLGGLPPKVPPERYATNLGQNFQVMTELVPTFVDPYFLCQSSLAHISSEQAVIVNEVLKRGMVARPNDIFLPFLLAYNTQHYLKNPHEAAKIYLQVSRMDGAPSWLGHLSAVLSADGGDIYGGLMSLRIIYSTEKDEHAKQRYADDIILYEKAALVAQAVDAYVAKYSAHPVDLSVLIPDFLSAMPDLGSSYYLEWHPPRLRLVRKPRGAIND